MSVGLLMVVALGTTLLSALTSWMVLHQQAETRVAGQAIGAAAARYGEGQRMLTQRRRLRAAQRFTESAVDETSRTVEDIHRGIASVPFEVLDRIPATRDTARIVREVHDLTSGTVYGSIRGINRLLGSGLRSGLGGSHDNSKKKRDDEQGSE
ncbi:hypothetical protein [Algiphilus aromaticivorans]|uniref:hypothetical protein n=1 Tax=Algiphilus aromaticivorans TaxID=382454 RepID=UPI0012EB97EF|nr:hypothetical protein [Algiphilus aromaticivorans]